MSDVVKDLAQPDGFVADWYGFVTNQAAHGVMIGLPIGAALILIGLPRWWALLIGVAAYGIGWEIAVQGWQGLDTIEDTIFVGIGIAAGVAMGPKRARAALGFVALLTLAMVPGIIKRLSERKDRQ